MTTFVLLYGGWRGGWAWTPVARRLEELGHRAYAPTMAGHGPDVDRARITNEHCVEGLVRYVEGRDLHDVVLVGHSGGGCQLTQAAPRLEGRLRRLVFWNAFVLDDGECVLDAIPPHYVALFEQLAGSTHDRAVMLPWGDMAGGVYAGRGREAARLAHSLLSPEPMGVLESKLNQRPFFELDVARSYVNCRQDISLPGEYTWSRALVIDSANISSLSLTARTRAASPSRIC